MPKTKTKKKLDSWHDLVGVSPDASPVSVLSLVEQDPPLVKVSPGIQGWWLMYLPKLPQGWPISARLAKEIERYLAPLTEKESRRQAVGLPRSRVHQANVNFMAEAIASGMIVILRAGIRSQNDAIDYALAQSPPARVAREGSGNKWAVYRLASNLPKDAAHAP